MLALCGCDHFVKVAAMNMIVVWFYSLSKHHLQHLTTLHNQQSTLFTSPNQFPRSIIRQEAEVLV